MQQLMITCGLHLIPESSMTCDNLDRAAKSGHAPSMGSMTARVPAGQHAEVDCLCLCLSPWRLAPMQQQAAHYWRGSWSPPAVSHHMGRLRSGHHPGTGLQTLPDTCCWHWQVRLYRYCALNHCQGFSWHSSAAATVRMTFHSIDWG